MNEKEKRETLANLYALRGGLSVVSEVKDDIIENLKVLENNRKEEEKNVEDAKNALSNLKVPKMQEITYTSMSSVNSAEKYMNDEKRKAAMFIFFSVLVGIIPISIDIFFASLYEMWVLIFFCPVNILLLPLIWLISEAKSHFDDYKKNKNLMSRYLNDIEYEKKLEKNFKVNYQKELEQYNAQKTELEKQLAAQKADSEKNIAESSVESFEYINERKEFGNALLEVLEDNYSHLLDKRDWANLDLFIYFYETDRADSKKEALQLIDQYNQNQNIVQAINNAGREVCLTINQGLGKLNNTIINCFDSLSTQLYNMHTTTMQKLNSIENDMQYVSESLGGFSGSLAGLKESIDFNNALKEKANETSAKLADDVNYIRTIDEIEEVRKRSGCNVSY